MQEITNQSPGISMDIPIGNEPNISINIPKKRGPKPGSKRKPKNNNDNFIIPPEMLNLEQDPRLFKKQQIDEDKFDLELIKLRVKQLHKDYPQFEKEVESDTKQAWLAEMYRVQSEIYTDEYISPIRDFMLQIMFTILMKGSEYRPELITEDFINKYMFLLKSKISIFDEDFKELLSYIPEVASLPWYYRIPMKLTAIFFAAKFLKIDPATIESINNKNKDL